MEVSKESFEKLKLLVGPTSKKPEQLDLLKEIDYRPHEICDEYLGKFFPSYLYEEPEEYDVEYFFEITYENPEKRIKEYKLNPVLSDEEKDKLYEYFYDEVLQGEGYLPIFTGEIKYKNKKLFAFATVVGDMMGGGYDDDLEGIFNTYEEGIKTLYSDGDIID